MIILLINCNFMRTVSFMVKFLIISQLFSKIGYKRLCQQTVKHWKSLVRAGSNTSSRSCLTCSQGFCVYPLDKKESIPPLFVRHIYPLVKFILKSCQLLVHHPIHFNMPHAKVRCKQSLQGVMIYHRQFLRRRFTRKTRNWLRSIYSSLWL